MSAYLPTWSARNHAQTFQERTPGDPLGRLLGEAPSVSAESRTYVEVGFGSWVKLRVCTFAVYNDWESYFFIRKTVRCDCYAPVPGARAGRGRFTIYDLRLTMDHLDPVDDVYYVEIIHGKRLGEYTRSQKSETLIPGKAYQKM